MKSFLISAAIFAGSLLLPFSHLWAFSPQTWSSPNGSLQVTLLATSYAADGPPNLELRSGPSGKEVPVTESPFAQSRIIREFAGLTWFEEIKPNWFQDQYLTFVNPEGSIGVIDAQSAKLLLNNSFEAIGVAPEPWLWAAIKYRPLARQQMTLRGDEKDTLLLIDLADTVKQSENPNTSQGLFSNLISAQLPGVALAKPIWQKGQDGTLQIKSVIWNWEHGQAEMLTFDGKTLRQISIEPLDLKVSKDVSYSPWIDKNFEANLLQKIEYGTLSLIKNQNEKKTSSASKIPTQQAPNSDVAIPAGVAEKNHLS